MNAGRVEAIFLAAAPGAGTFPVDAVEAKPGRGLEGDRKFVPPGGPAREPGAGQDLTLIEAEAVEGLRADTGIDLGLGGSRRNVVTRDVALNDLVGRRFRVGGAECLGVELCEPCRHLERLTEPGVLRGLVHRGGLRADVVSGGTVAVGDAVVELP